MKKTYVLSTILVMLLAVGNLMAQLSPQPSPRASVLQVVGLTEIKIDYSSPGAKGRKVWGDLVPFDKIWRAGANSPTKISFNDEVTIEGTKVAAGSYSLMVIPTAAEWTFIISKDPKNAGAFGYEQANDVVRIKAPVKANAEPKERLAYYIEVTGETSAKVTLSWEAGNASFAVNVDPKAKTLANIEKATNDAGNAWYTYASAAEYYLDQNLDVAKANQWLDQSLAIKAHPYNLYQKARAAAKQGNKAEAMKYAKQAKDMIDKDGGKDNFYAAMKERVEKGIAEWSK